MNENNIKVLFPEGVETITISKNDYDRLFGQLTYENIVLQSKIDKANEVLNQYMPNYASCVKALDEIEFILKEDK